MQAKPGFELLTACPICGKKLIEIDIQYFPTPLSTLQIGEAKVNLFTQADWAKCRNCGVEYQSRRLNPKSLATYYETDLYREFIDDGGMEGREESSDTFAGTVVQYLQKHEVMATRQLDFGSALGSLLFRVDWEGVGVELSYNSRGGPESGEVKFTTISPRSQADLIL